MTSSLSFSRFLDHPAMARVMLMSLDAGQMASFLYFAKAVLLGVAASSIAVAYSEMMFRGTRSLYRQGKLERYFPLPAQRGIVTAWINTMSFTVPTALYAMYLQPDMERSFTFNPFYMLGYMFLYMVMHDSFFYWCHRESHLIKPLYDWFHAMHHEYSYSMTVFAVGHAEFSENFIQVGLPWLTWTAIAGHNWWYWTMPLSFVLYTTLIGHAGYRSSYYLLFFHPLALPIVLLTPRWLLSAGDHQAHHCYRRVNYGLFFRFWDKAMGSYKKCNTRAYDVHFWQTWARNKGKAEHDTQARKWLGKHNLDFHETEWGF